MRERGKRRRTGRLPRSLRARTHRAAGLPGCLPTARLPFCGGKKKIEPWRFNGLRGLPSEKRGREGGETKATRLRQLRDSFCITEATVCRQFGIRQLKFRVALRPVSLFFFPRRVRDNRHGAAPTWPDCNDCAEVKRAHTEGGEEHIYLAQLSVKLAHRRGLLYGLVSNKPRKQARGFAKVLFTLSKTVFTGHSASASRLILMQNNSLSWRKASRLRCCDYTVV